MHQRQNGFSHVLIVIGLIIALIIGLGYVFIRNYQRNEAQQTPTSQSEMFKPIPTDGSSTEIVRDLNVKNWKSFKSDTGSGLSFKYPKDWSFDPPSEPQISRPNGMKILLMGLYSSKPGSDEADEEGGYMCVSLTEITGGDQFTDSSYPKDVSVSEDFYVGPNQISLVTRNSGMQLYNKEAVSEHGASYIPLDNGYYLVATAQYNCASPDKIDLDSGSAVKQAKLILKSIRVTN